MQWWRLADDHRQWPSDYVVWIRSQEEASFISVWSNVSHCAQYAHSKQISWTRINLRPHIKHVAGICDASIVKKAFQPLQWLLSSSTILYGWRTTRMTCYNHQLEVWNTLRLQICSHVLFQVIWLYAFRTTKMLYNSTETVVLAGTKLLSSTFKIAHADDKLPLFWWCPQYVLSAVTYHIINNHKCPLLLFC